MRKIFSCLIACIILSASIIPCSIFAESADTNIYEIYENFENDISEWNLTGTGLAKSSGTGVNGGNSAYGAMLTSDFCLVPGNAYKISGWFRVDANLSSSVLGEDNTFTLQWYHNGHGVSGDSDYVRFKDTKTKVNYVKGEWQYFEMDFTYSESVAITTTVWLQIYGVTGVKYYLDDYSVTANPVKAAEVTASFAEPVLYPGMDNVSARISSKKTGGLLAVIASYSENGKMEQAVMEEITSNEKSISIPSASNIEMVKLFVFDKDRGVPYMDQLVLRGQEDASFVFVDAQKGSDSNAGSFSKPVKSLTKAMSLVENAMGAEGINNVNVMLKSGEHILEDPIVLDSGIYSGSKKVTFTSYGDGKATISGARHVTGWTIYDEEKDIYKAKVDKNIIARQMYINGIRGTKARSEGPLTDATRYTATGDVYGYKCSDTFLADFERIDDMEVVFEELWSNSYCSIDTITAENGIANIVLDNPGAAYCFIKGDTSATLPVYYQNALELLDEPGEWYYNRETGDVYYKPRNFEDIRTADIVLPDNIRSDERYFNTVHSLIAMEGTADNPVDNITFSNIDFAYSSYQVEPSGNSGYAGVQGNFRRTAGNDYISVGVVNGKNVRNITFEGCDFSKLGTTALNLVGAVQNCNVIGNEFYNLSATAIHLGDIDNETAVNPGEAANPSEEKYEVKDNLIANNYIHDVGNDFKASVGISVGFPKDTVIRNNEIFDVPFDGMHLGYGWAEYQETGTALENLRVEGNYIHHVLNDNLYDGGGIYTLGTTGGSENNFNYITRNYITHVENHYGAIYTDNSSSYWSINDNVIDLIETPLWYKDGKTGRPSDWLLGGGGPGNRVYNNYTTTSNVNIMWDETVNHFDSSSNKVYPTADWPDEAKQIVEEAGLEAQYLALYPEKVQTVELPEKCDIATGESYDLKANITAKARKGAEADLSEIKTYFRSLDPDVAQVSATGSVTGMTAGVAVIETTVVIGEKAEVFKTCFYVDDRANELVVPQGEVYMTTYSSFDLQAEVESLFGQKLSDYAITYESSDTSIANVSEAGVVSGVSKGETVIKIRATINGALQEKLFTVKVVASGSNEKYILDTELDDTTKWADDKSYDVLKIDNGIRLKTPRFAAIYEGRTFMDETIKFKMRVTKGSSSGDGFVIRSSDSRGDNCYRLTINNGAKKIQLCRYNDGVGSETFVESKAVDISLDGSRIHDVEITARNEANGVRIIFILDGKEIINYLDTGEGAIREAGYFGAIVRYGTIDVLK